MRQFLILLLLSKEIEDGIIIHRQQIRRHIGELKSDLLLVEILVIFDDVIDQLG